MSQGAEALQGLITRIDNLHKLVNFWPNFIEFHLHPEIPSTLSELAFHQGIASTILFNDSPKAHKENGATYKLRLERFSYVRRKCEGISTSVLSDRKIRNSLTHVDEHLAKALAQPKTGWIIDSAIGRRDQLTASQHGIEISFCRTYISAEDVLLHLGNEISVKNLRKEAVDVLMAVWNAEPYKLPELRDRPLVPPNLSA